MSSNPFQRVRESCQFVLDNAKEVKVLEGGIENFLNNLDLAKFKEKTSTVKFPLRFDTVEDEVNFICLVDVLNFASGFRKPLHKYAGRGAYETICYGMISMVLSGRKLTSDYLTQISISDIETQFGFPISVEKSVQTGITTLSPSELRPLADYLVAVLNDTGKILRNRGFKSLGHYIMDQIASQTEPSAASLIENLTSVFPALNDKSQYEGREIYIYKKVQLLVGDLYRRFASEDKRFDFKDIDQLTVFTDNVLPAVLRKLGITEYSESLSKHIDEGIPLKSGPLEVEIRASAIPISDQIVTIAKEKFKDDEETSKLFSAMQLDYYLWTVGKDPEFRTCERHYTQDTVFY